MPSLLFATTAMRLQQNLLHREFWIQLLLERALPLAIPLLVWVSIFDYAQSGSLAGLAENDMIAYYLLVFVIGIFTDIQFHFEMSTMVHMGTLSQWLIRPLTFFEVVLSYVSARVVVLLIPSTIVLLLCVWIFPSAFTGLSLASAFNSLFVLPLALVLFSLLSVLVGMLAFWLIKTDSIFTLLMVVLEFFGGRILPLDILPAWLERISRILPLRFAISGPVEAILHPHVVSLPSLLFGQMAWCVILSCLTYLLWRAGLRRYDAVGG